MAKAPNYLLSPTAIRQLREQKLWSIKHFGETATQRYFIDIERAVDFLVKNHQRLAPRAQLIGDSGFLLYPVGRHYLVYDVVGDDIHIAAFLAQAQDVPTILQDNKHYFTRELAAIKTPRKKSGKRKK